ncbi:MAG: two pore domain potassium channel family protein [Bdellovibrionales bacterium]|nr:two pore domain potassium channel family protein [Massilia sp.]
MLIVLFFLRQADCAHGADSFRSFKHPEHPAARARNPQPQQAADRYFCGLHGPRAGNRTYGSVLFGSIHFTGTGSLRGIGSSSLENCLYFSAESFSSLGFGDLIPNGPIRLLAGTEAQNGLLLIGRSASYAYLAMARFWGVTSQDGES